MKRLFPFLLTIVGLFSTGVLSAQVINVPSKAQKHFNDTYAGAKDLNWSNNVTYYIAKFSLNDNKYRARYHINGNWDFTEMESEMTKFPAEVQSSFSKSRFADWTVKSAAEVSNSKKQHLYRIQMEKGLEKRYIFFDEKGKEVKSTMTI